MSRDFAEGRMPVPGMPADELSDLLSIVAEAFDPIWLAEKSGNRVQDLWSRLDGLATSQLAMVGDAITKMSALNADWVAKCVEKIKAEEKGQRHGFLFELLGLNLFNVGGQTVKATKEFQAGYDGVITGSDGGTALVSLKDFGRSEARARFEHHAAQIDYYLFKHLRAVRVTGTAFGIAAPSYPSEDDWRRLRSQLLFMVRKFRQEGQLDFVVGGFWQVVIGGMPNYAPKLHPAHSSYSMLIRVPHHANEQKNIDDRIEKALFNMSKHTVAAADGVLRMVLMRVPETADTAQCIAVATAWLQERPSSPIGLVLIYQPCVAMNKDGNSGLVHFIDGTGGLKIVDWLAAENGRKPILSSSLIGLTVDKPTRMTLFNGETLYGQYTFQRGHIYLRHEMGPDGPIGTVLTPAPGILVHSIMEIPGQVGSITVKGKFPPDDMLLIYQ